MAFRHNGNMPTEHAISALLQTRKEIAGQIEALSKKVTTLEQDLIHVDATLRIMGYDGPGLSLGARRSSSAGLFHRNELGRYIREYFRKHPDGFTARDLCRTICLERGWDSTHKPLMDALVEKASRFLTAHAKKGGWYCDKAGNAFIWRKQ